MSNPVPSAPHTLVVFEVGGLGDSIITLAAMQALRARFPSSRLVRVHDARMSSFFEACPFVDELVGYDKTGSKVTAALKLARTLRAMRPDVIVNLHTPDFDRPLGQYLRDGLFFAAVGAAERVAWRHSVDRPLHTRSLPRESFDDHTMFEAALALVSLLDAAPQVGPLRYWLAAGERERARELLARQARAAGLSAESGYFCVSPFARAATREWDLGRMGDAISTLVRRSGLTPVVLGGVPDRARLAPLAARAGPFVDLVGSSTLRDAAALFEEARLLVAVDSGLMHLGALSRTPTVAIFGPGHPRRWQPLPQAPLRVVWSHPKCGPCYLTECADLSCQRGVTLKDVVGAALDLLGQS
jgi:heptosyltransferase-1